MTVAICLLKQVLQQMKISLDTICIFMWNRHISPPDPLAIIGWRGGNKREANGWEGCLLYTSDAADE